MFSCFAHGICDGVKSYSVTSFHLMPTLEEMRQRHVASKRLVDFSSTQCMAYVFITKWHHLNLDGHHVFAYGRKTVRAFCFFFCVLLFVLGLGWGGVGGHVNVPCTSCIIYCHVAKISGIVCYVTCCYAAEILGTFVLRDMLVRC